MKLNTHDIINFFSSIVIIVSFYPINNQGVGVNYFYLILPLFGILLRKKIYPINLFLKIFIIYLFIIFFIFLILRIDQEIFLYRTVLSFISFMTIFSFIFYKFTEKSLEIFKLSIVIFSLLISFYIFAKYLDNQVILRDGFQRIGFILSSAFLILAFDNNIFKKKIISFLIFFTILLGILLIQSRATFLCLFFSFLLSLVLRDIHIKIKYIFFFFLFGFFINQYLYSFYFYFINFFLNLLSFDVVKNLDYDESSEAKRFQILLYVLSSKEFLFSNGFLGIWSINEIYSSTHNQYTDIILRIGIVGLVFYLFIICSLLFFLKKIDKALFYAFFGILIYSFFHETFKEPNGSLILSYLFGYMIY
jgi:hypothetical protein